jgi:uncharacterized membrane protein YcaP (DUF421 family)
MLITFVRATILYIIVLIVMRLMGKREIGQMQPFELVISFMIADLASIPMTDIGIPIFNGILPILGLLTMHLIISFLNIKSINFRKIVRGIPAILVKKGKIDEDALEKERLTVNELQEKLRGQNVFNLGDVDYVILETNGKITVIQKPEKQNTTPEDFNMTPEFEGMTYDLVLDGTVMNDNLKKIGKDQKWLMKQVEKMGYTPKETLIATINEKGDFFCQRKEEKKKGNKR